MRHFLKVALFWGDNDWLAAKEDLCKIMTQVTFSNVKPQITLHYTGSNGCCQLSSAMEGLEPH